MTHKKALLFQFFFIVLCTLVFSAPLYSPTWGFRMDLPEGYEFIDGDGREKFSFEHPDGAMFDLVVYNTDIKTPHYSSVEEMAQDIKKRLNSSGDVDTFYYRQKKAGLLELDFSIPGTKPTPMIGWALCLPLVKSNAESAGPPPLLLAMAYGPAEKQELQVMHLSALDSLAPQEGDRLYPGPITEFSYPRETRMQAPIFGLGISALFYEEEAEAAQALIDREYQILKRYANMPYWQELWIRFYRAIYRDSFDRLSGAAFQIERKLNVPPRENRDFADQALQWVQSFKYERDLMGSDFVNVVSAAIEGRGDCDSRAMLWAIILKHANIQSAIMVSREHSHAMGLADVDGVGARFEVGGNRLLVAETTTSVSIGLIGETISDIESWLGVPFN